MAKPIADNSLANYDIDIFLLNVKKLSGNIVEIIDDEHSLSPDTCVILKFKLKTFEGDKIIDLFEIATVWNKI